MMSRYATLIFATIFLAILVTGPVMAADEQVIKVSAKRFEYSPAEITLKKGVPVVIEFTSQDRLHGFNCPGLKIRSDIPPGKVTTLRFVPDKTGAFPFHCDNFCGTGHEKMRGTITVVE